MSKNDMGRLKGFTIIEMLVVMALTSLSITLSYMGLNQVQKMFISYKTQNSFLDQYINLKERLNYEALKSTVVIEDKENHFVISRDSLNTFLVIEANRIVMKRNGRCDTFNIQAKHIQKEYELIKNPQWTNKLLRSLYFEVEFSGQWYFFRFDKKHDANVKLNLETDRCV